MADADAAKRLDAVTARVRRVCGGCRRTAFPDACGSSAGVAGASRPSFSGPRGGQTGCHEGTASDPAFGSRSEPGGRRLVSRRLPLLWGSTTRPFAAPSLPRFAPGRQAMDKSEIDPGPGIWPGRHGWFPAGWHQPSTNQFGAMPPPPYGEIQPMLEEGDQGASTLDDSLATAMVVYK
eukprot:scaffold1895_cov123-Isochrysis_galbana.AAC.15